jgi:hypothetical protein
MVHAQLGKAALCAGAFGCWHAEEALEGRFAS